MIGVIAVSVDQGLAQFFAGCDDMAAGFGIEPAAEYSIADRSGYVPGTDDGGWLAH